MINKYRNFIGQTFDFIDISRILQFVKENNLELRN